MKWTIVVLLTLTSIYAFAQANRFSATADIMLLPDTRLLPDGRIVPPIDNPAAEIWLSDVVSKIKPRWAARMPASVRSAKLQSGWVWMEADVASDGRVTVLRIPATDFSGLKTSYEELDELERAAWDSVRGLQFAPVPPESRYKTLRLDMYFYYNPDKLSGRFKPKPIFSFPNAPGLRFDLP